MYGMLKGSCIFGCAGPIFQNHFSVLKWPKHAKAIYCPFFFFVVCLLYYLDATRFNLLLKQKNRVTGLMKKYNKMCLILAWRPMIRTFANNADPSQTPHNVVSDHGLNCLLNGDIKQFLKLERKRTRPLKWQVDTSSLQWWASWVQSLLTFDKIRLLTLLKLGFLMLGFLSEVVNALIVTPLDFAHSETRVSRKPYRPFPS